MARRKTAKAEEIKQDVQSGDVVGVTDEILTEKNDTVVICANIPHARKFNVPDKSGKFHTVTINGNNTPLIGADRGVIPIGAYGITANVLKSDWEYIKTVYGYMSDIKEERIFDSTSANARAEAKERKDLRHGLEPVDPQAARNSEPLN